MKHFIHTAVVLAAFCSSFVAQAPGVPGPMPTPAPQAPKPVDPNGPKINSPKPTHDFGEAPQNDKVEIEFVLENLGKSELDIIRVNPTCGCTVASPEKNKLAPGDRTVVKTTFNTQTFEGLVTKSIVVESNDAANPRYNLTITGRVSQAFRPSVKELNFGTLRKGVKFPEATMDVLTAGGIKAVILDIQSDHPLVKARFDRLPENAPMKGYRVTATIDQSAAVGQLRGTLTFITDLASQKQLSVPFSAIIDGEVGVKPRQFNFGSVKAGDTSVVREIEVTKTGDATLKIEGLDLKPEGLFKAELVEVKPGQEYKIKVSLLPGVKAGYQRGTLTIRTNVPGEDSIAAYFYAMIKAD
jgi:hypothetical protein